MYLMDIMEQYLLTDKRVVEKHILLWVIFFKNLRRGVLLQGLCRVFFPLNNYFSE